MPPISPLSRSYRILAVLAALTLFLDQLSKWAVVSHLPYLYSSEIIPGFFNLVHVRNRGAAFGFLNRSDIDWQIWLFLAVTAVAGAVILKLVRSFPGSRWLPASLGFVLGGAAGNLIDRLRFHAVIDFMDLYVGAWHWPAFNIADTAICCGAALACLILWRTPDSEKRRAR